MERILEARTLLVLASAVILLALGVTHLVYTFWGRSCCRVIRPSSIR